MTQRSTIVYTCERCGQELSRRSQDGPANDWGRMQAHAISGSFYQKIGHGDAPHTHVDLCAACLRSLLSWWEGAKSTATAEPQGEPK